VAWFVRACWSPIDTWGRSKDLDDYLWKHIKLLSDYLAGDVTSGDDYCSGTRCYHWTTGSLTDLAEGEYEAELEEFLLQNPAAKVKSGLDVMVLIGGTGMGKSTTVRRLIQVLRSRTRVCSCASNADGQCAGDCSCSPIVLCFDTGDVSEPARNLAQKERVGNQSIEFYNIAAAQLETLLGSGFSFEKEVEFWAWALDEPQIRYRSREVRTWLNQSEHQIRAVATRQPYAGWSLKDLEHSLEDQRTNLIGSLLGVNLVWYRVFQLVYAIKFMSLFRCSCRYVFLDNVDQLEPEVQRELVDFVILLSDVLGARALISIRPLTWERSVHATMLLRVKNHCSPAVREVMLKRVARLALDTSCPPHVAEYLRSLVSSLTAPGSLWGEMFDATSGLSVRFAMRNFLNFAQSRLLPPLSEYANPLDKMRASEVARSFFFGSGENLLHANLENLYALGTDMRQEYRLIKARILDVLIRVCEGSTSLEDLNFMLRRFGYQPESMRKAVNDLLLRSRPLLWSQDGFKISTMESHAKIAVTPIGRGYYKILFGQLYYDEVCIAKSSSDILSLDQVIAFHKELWEQDQREILLAVRKHPIGFYLKLYPRAQPALSAIHAANLKEGVERRSSSPPPGYDPGRVEAIARGVESLLASRW
jgi:energy-coupling factor transporter ATP-binding protein EcfA2